MRAFVRKEETTPRSLRFPGWWQAALAAGLLAGCGGGGDATAPLDAPAAATGQATAAVADGPADEATPGCASRNNNSMEKVLECMTLKGVRSHQAALQGIADRNGGIRASGTSGYDASAWYVARTLRAAGYHVTRQPFDFQAFDLNEEPTLEVVAPTPRGVEHFVLAYSGSADVTAPVTALPGLASDATPGCEAADFAGFPAGHIALVQRGECEFAVKAANAAGAGAVGVVIYNNRAGNINGTLNAGFTLDIPVTSMTQAEGEALAGTAGLRMRLKVDAFRGLVSTSNIIAESQTGDPDNVVMVGAHLDSVRKGPGINDNGSGSAAILETALILAKLKPHNRIRFAFWGAEESGLVGSINYVNSLKAWQLKRIALYLNFDMIGSPNPVYFIYDGDDSDKTGEGPGPAGSAEIEKAFEDFYTRRGQPFKGTDFDGRSDYGPFIAAGIPSGGLFTGAEGIKTDEEARLWGGTAGQAYDPCYHKACDNYANNDNPALLLNSKAVAAMTFKYATALQLPGREAGTEAARGAYKAPTLQGPQDVK